jgi:hypothetical protein
MKHERQWGVWRGRERDWERESSADGGNRKRRTQKVKRRNEKKWCRTKSTKRRDASILKAAGVDVAAAKSSCGTMPEGQISATKITATV